MLAPTTRKDFGKISDDNHNNSKESLPPLPKSLEIIKIALTQLKKNSMNEIDDLVRNLKWLKERWDMAEHDEMNRENER